MLEHLQLVVWTTLARYELGDWIPAEWHEPQDSGIFDTPLGPIILIIFVIGLFYYYGSKNK